MTDVYGIVYDQATGDILSTVQAQNPVQLPAQQKGSRKVLEVPRPDIDALRAAEEWPNVSESHRVDISGPAALVRKNL